MIKDLLLSAKFVLFAKCSEKSLSKRKKVKTARGFTFQNPICEGKNPAETGPTGCYFIMEKRKVKRKIGFFCKIFQERT